MTHSFECHMALHITGPRGCPQMDIWVGLLRMTSKKIHWKYWQGHCILCMSSSATPPKCLIFSKHISINPQCLSGDVMNVLLWYCLYVVVFSVQFYKNKLSKMWRKMNIHLDMNDLFHCYFWSLFLQWQAILFKFARLLHLLQNILDSFTILASLKLWYCADHKFF